MRARTAKDGEHISTRAVEQPPFADFMGMKITLLTRERISPYYFFSYTFIPLSAIAFPHILIFCLTAKRMVQFKKTVIFYPLCILLIWSP